MTLDGRRMLASELAKPKFMSVGVHKVTVRDSRYQSRWVKFRVTDNKDRTWNFKLIKKQQTAKKERAVLEPERSPRTKVSRGIASLQLLKFKDDSTAFVPFPESFKLSYYLPDQIHLSVDRIGGILSPKTEEPAKTIHTPIVCDAQQAEVTLQVTNKNGQDGVLATITLNGNPLQLEDVSERLDPVSKHGFAS